MPLIARLAFALMMVCCCAARAETVTDLYSAEVPVAGQDRASRDRAARNALAEVLVKVSGSTAVLEIDALNASLSRAPDLVQQYTYRRDPEGLRARFEFDDAVVGELIADAGAPLWTANRPATLVWIAVDDAGGRRFLTADGAPELLAEVRNAFDQRGLPVQLPLHDLADATALSVDQLWRLDGGALINASSRYEVEHILAGRLTRLSSGEWLGDWAYISDQGRQDRRVSAPDQQQFVASGSALVAESLASRYAVMTTGTRRDSVLMQVTGVTGYADYSALVQWLEGLELVEHANVEKLQGGSLLLRLTARAEVAQLRPTIELNRRLQSAPPLDPSVPLSYQWVN